MNGIARTMHMLFKFSKSHKIFCFTELGRLRRASHFLGVSVRFEWMFVVYYFKVKKKL